jgi:hypothetical protein
LNPLFQKQTTKYVLLSVNSRNPQTQSKLRNIMLFFVIDFCICDGSSDPHYYTPDGAVIHFMGTCKYTLWNSTIPNDRWGKGKGYIISIKPYWTLYFRNKQLNTYYWVLIQEIPKLNLNLDKKYYMMKRHRKYTLWNSTIPNDRCEFRVETKNERRSGNNNVAWTRFIDFYMQNTTIRILRGGTTLVSVLSLPFYP